MSFCYRLQKNCKNLYASYILFVDKLRAGRFLSSCNTAPWSSWLVTRPFQGCNAGSIPAGAIYFPHGELVSADIKSGFDSRIGKTNRCNYCSAAGFMSLNKADNSYKAGKENLRLEFCSSLMENHLSRTLAQVLKSRLVESISRCGASSRKGCYICGNTVEWSNVLWCESLQRQMLY